MSAIRVLGVHPVDAREPVHLIEIRAAGNEIDWNSITQTVEGKARDYWQAPYDEQQVPGSINRWCFFFHYLDQTRPLSSAAGDLVLPTETPLPAHLQFMKYEAP